MSVMDINDTVGKTVSKVCDAGYSMICIHFADGDNIVISSLAGYDDDSSIEIEDGNLLDVGTRYTLGLISESDHDAHWDGVKKRQDEKAEEKDRIEYERLKKKFGERVILPLT